MRASPALPATWARVPCTRRFLLTALLAIPACKPAPKPNPERGFTLYDIAWRCGQRDRLTPRDRDWHRYDLKLASFADVPERELIFQGGYADGFEQHPDEPVSDPIHTYDRDFRRGRLDAWQGTPAIEATEGYRDGFYGRKHKHGRPY